MFLRQNCGATGALRWVAVLLIMRRWINGQDLNSVDAALAKVQFLEFCFEWLPQSRHDCLLSPPLGQLYNLNWVSLRCRPAASVFSCRMLAKPPPRSLPAKPIPLKEQERLMFIQLISVSIFILHLIWFAACLSNTVGFEAKPKVFKYPKRPRVYVQSCQLSYNIDDFGIMFPSQLRFFSPDVCSLEGMLAPCDLMYTVYKGFFYDTFLVKLSAFVWTMSWPWPTCLSTASHNSKAWGQLLARCGHLSPKYCLGHHIACNSRPDSLVCKQCFETETKEDKIVYSGCS